MLYQFFLNLLSYPFFRNALLTSILLSIVCACLGQVLLLKHLSLASDAFSHSALTGVALGLALGYNPTVIAIIVCIVASLLIEFFRYFFKSYAELAIAIIMSLCIGLAGIFSKYMPYSADLNSFLFGSIVSINNQDLVSIFVLCGVILIIFAYLYYPLYLVCLDARNAALLGINVKLLNCVFNILTAVCIAACSHSAGTLIVSSLLVLPAASAFVWKLSYFQTLLLAICFGIINTITSFFLAFVLNWPTGGSLVIVSTLNLLLSLTIYQLIQHLPNNNQKV